MIHFTFVILTVGKEMPNKYPSIMPTTADNMIRKPSFDLGTLLLLRIDSKL
jgi:hypothetical protein